MAKKVDICISLTKHLFKVTVVTCTSITNQYICNLDSTAPGYKKTGSKNQNGFGTAKQHHVIYYLITVNNF